MLHGWLPLSPLGFLTLRLAWDPLRSHVCRGSLVCVFKLEGLLLRIQKMNLVWQFSLGIVWTHAAAVIVLIVFYHTNMMKGVVVQVKFRKAFTSGAAPRCAIQHREDFDTTYPNGFLVRSCANCDL